MAEKAFKFYAHSGKDDNWYQATNELGLGEDAARTFMYCGYEVEFDCMVDTDTGVVTATKVDGVELVKPITLT